MIKSKPFRPDWISAPGDSIEEILKDRKLELSDFAEQLDETIEQTTNLVKGHAEIDYEIAVKLEKLIGATAEFWMARERKYREELNNHESDHQFIEGLPLKDMIKFGWIQESKDNDELLASCLNFFQVSSAKTWFETYRDVIETAAFRTSLTFNSHTGSVAAWLRQGQIIAENVECDKWNPEKLKEILPSIRRLTRETDPKIFLPELIKLCSECGVAVIILQAPSGCRASGATRFISNNKALLLLSFRYLSDDHFWFTFFHEVGHILLHNKNSLYVDEAGASEMQEETEADNFAANLLIPNEFKQQLRTLSANKRDVIRFARQIGVSRGIVVGQLQHLGILKRNQLNDLKVRFTWQ